MEILKYLNNSNLKISIDFNPFVWSLRFHRERPTNIDPKLHILYARILPLSFLLVIDNGDYVLPDYEFAEEKTPDKIVRDYM